MAYTVHIKEVATGTVRACHMDLEWEDGSEYWWSEGNMSCDCNRALEFDRAGGTPDKVAWEKDRPCGDGAYVIVDLTGDVWEKDKPYVIEQNR